MTPVESCVFLLVGICVDVLGITLLAELDESFFVTMGCEVFVIGTRFSAPMPHANANRVMKHMVTAFFMSQVYTLELKTVYLIYTCFDKGANRGLLFLFGYA